MYLNTFNTQEVISVFDEVMSKYPDIILSKNFSDFTREEAMTQSHLVLDFSEMFRRITINKLDLDNPLFPNTNCTCTIASRKAFIRECSLVSDVYKQLMSI